MKFGVVLLGVVLLACSSRAAVIQRLDFYPHKISGDGRVVFGTTGAFSGDLIRYTIGGAREVIGTLPQLGSPAFVWGVSDDGGVAVGQITGTPGGFFWSAATGLDIPQNSEAYYGVSGDGKTWLRGTRKLTASSSTALPGFGFAVSRDGSVVAGQLTPSSTGNRAFRLDATGQQMPPLETSSQPRAMTPDGKIIAGTYGEGIFVWEGDTAHLYPYEDPTHKWLPYDITADGRTVVGFDLMTSRVNGPTLLHDGVEYRLAEYLGLDGWRVQHARGISDDGQVMLGWRYTDADGVTGPGFIAFVPEPGFVAGAWGAMMLLGRARRGRGVRVAGREESAGKPPR